MEINSILSDLKVFISNAKAGEGAVNYLLQDSIFVQYLDTTMQNIEEGAIRLNENMEAKKAAKEAEKNE